MTTAEKRSSVTPLQLRRHVNRYVRGIVKALARSRYSPAQLRILQDNIAARLTRGPFPVAAADVHPDRLQLAAVIIVQSRLCDAARAIRERKTRVENFHALERELMIVAIHDSLWDRTIGKAEAFQLVVWVAQEQEAAPHRLRGQAGGRATAARLSEQRGVEMAWSRLGRQGVAERDRVSLIAEEKGISRQTVNKHARALRTE